MPLQLVSVLDGAYPAIGSAVALSGAATGVGIASPAGTVAATGTAGGITHGRQITAANTGIAGAGLTTGDLTTVAGSVTYSTANQIVEFKRFTGDVLVTAANVTIRKCQFDIGAGSSSKGLVAAGTGLLVEDVTGRATSGSHYMTIHHQGNGLTVRRCDLSGAENIITVEADGLTLEDSYLHGTSIASNPTGHADVIEIYGGSGHTLSRSKIAQTFTLGDSPINIAPWYGSTIVDGVTIADCYLSGGNSHLLVDLQSTGYIRNVKVLRCDMDGHTDNGRYSAFQDNDGRGTVQTSAAQASNQNAVLWPNTGADASHWVDCADLTPNNSGQVIVA